jgi:hypothetical protein
LKQDRPYSLPKGTQMQSPNGMRFVVEECVQHSDTRFLVKGACVLDPNQELEHSEDVLIREGFLWPEIGWKVTWMPGFVTRPPIMYHNQLVQPPLLARVDSRATDGEIMFESCRKFVSYQHERAISFETTRMQSIHRKCRRMIDM